MLTPCLLRAFSLPWYELSSASTVSLSPISPTRRENGCLSPPVGDEDVGRPGQLPFSVRSKEPLHPVRREDQEIGEGVAASRPFHAGPVIVDQVEGERAPRGVGQVGRENYL